MMVSIFVEYFDELFTSINANDISSILDFLDCRLTDDIHWDLDKGFISQEVKQVVDQLHVGKALEPDGLSATFYN